MLYNEVYKLINDIYLNNHESYTNEIIQTCNNFEVSSVGSTEDWYCCAEPTEQHLVAVDFSK